VIDSDVVKTTIDIPEETLKDAMRFTGARTKREAVLIALEDLNRRMRMAELIRHAGTCSSLMTVEALQKQRRRG
jgi:Arc/MetJ family transcription regulator